MDSHVKDKGGLATVLSLNMRLLYLGKTVFILRQGPGQLLVVVMLILSEAQLEGHITGSIWRNDNERDDNDINDLNRETKTITHKLTR